MKKARIDLFTACLTAAIASMVYAEPIEIPNAGFEDRETFDPFPEGTDKYPQWSRESWRHFDISANGGPLRIWNPGKPGVDDTGQGVLDVAFDGEAPEGKYVMLVRSRENDPSRTFEAVTQLLTETFDLSQAYTLTAMVGKLPEADAGGSVNYNPDWFGYRVQFVVGGSNVDGATYAGQVIDGVVLAEDDNSLDVTANEFITSTVIYTPNPEDSVHDGLPIQIRLCALETPVTPEDDSLAGWVAFDEVTLQTGAVPAPSQSILVTDVSFSAEDERITLTWDSREGRTYSTDLIDWSGDLDDGVVADAGTSTTRTYPVSELSGDETSLFFRIEKN